MFRISTFKPQAFEGSGCRAAAARAHCSAPVRQKLEPRHGAKNLFAPAARKREPLHQATINELLTTDYWLLTTDCSFEKSFHRRSFLPIAMSLVLISDAKEFRAGRNRFSNDDQQQPPNFDRG